MAFLNFLRGEYNPHVLYFFVRGSIPCSESFKNAFAVKEMPSSSASWRWKKSDETQLPQKIEVLCSSESLRRPDSNFNFDKTGKLGRLRHLRYNMPAMMDGFESNERLNKSSRNIRDENQLVKFLFKN